MFNIKSISLIVLTSISLTLSACSKKETSQPENTSSESQTEQSSATTNVSQNETQAAAIDSTTQENATGDEAAIAALDKPTESAEH
ncbi:hypothetical protein [Acinetobacter stercoris]|uniref:Lipoprotein n=1 Tax=Acinetobacter stercoris TaxID=2126983 RepID=A0A2U3N4I6_9GAMM|nr:MULTISPECIES: hypothetical protein [Acinetobacter]SPL72582.1 hypothetical protein KPC_3760 [Acinetobacter stercoris]